MRLSFLKAVLQAEGLEVFVFGADVGALWPGALPARLMVRAGEADQARAALAAADPSLIWSPP